MLKSDFQDILRTFIYTNLPALMNPMSSVVIVTNAPPTSATPDTDTIVVTPEVLSVLQTYVLNNFPNLNLPSDIQAVAKQFFALNTTVNDTFTVSQ
ncbi:hypothetical protein [Sporomusa malonica]|uniref:Uncharacterized protein n=1 Tax=Sporomusa malonica TaxID=112901 RepID=A0A1W2CNE1_9FIRM|nr:hypothetical protein [Sporomusa malonica]SMC86757.1 hypothetical protein SAMN04488500_11143 [Sporomusa malonica]